MSNNYGYLRMWWPRIEALIGPAVLYLLVIAISLMTALFVVIGQWPLAFAMVAIVFSLIFYHYMLSNPLSIGKRDIFFWAIVCVSLGTSVFLGTVGLDLRFLAELTLLAASPLLLSSVAAWLKSSRFARWLVCLLVIFIIMSLLSSFIGRTTPKAGIYQFVTNLKFPIAIALGFYLSWTEKTERNFWMLVQWAWLPLIVTVIWQWTLPSSYTAIFDSGGTYVYKPFAAGGEHRFLPVPTARGPFEHPYILAFFSSILGLFSAVRFLVRRQKSFIVAGIFYLLALIASGQRQEFVAFLLTVFVIISVYRGRKFFWRAAVLSVISATFIGTALWSVAGDNLLDEAKTWGFSGHAEVTHPRPVLYMTAIDIANQQAPLGSGLGTFGSAGALKFDRSLYYERGFERYNWFLEGRNVLMDASWTQHIAESGWIGFATLVLFMVSLLVYAARMSLACTGERKKILWLCALSGVCFAIGTSPTSPILEDPSIAISAVFIGIAINAKERSVNSHDDAEAA